MYQRALSHQGKPSLAGQARFSSLVAAPGHGGLISNRGLSAARTGVSQVTRERQGPRDAFLATSSKRCRQTELRYDLIEGSRMVRELRRLKVP